MRRHKRSLLLALLLCCVSAVAMAGIYRREINRHRNEELNDLVEMKEANEDQLPSEEEISALVQSALGDENADSAGEPEDTTAPAGEPVPFIEETDTEEKTAAEPDTILGEAAAETAVEPVSEETLLQFGEDSVLAWPVQGDVLSMFSMDRTVYFPTLAQYKYNPGMLIQGEEGTMVYAGADGRVIQIGQSDELGCTVTMDLGNSYTVKYGQLKALNVKEGDLVTAGTAIGLVAAPTKYYVVEGDHVYMELQHEGVPVDPLDYLD